MLNLKQNIGKYDRLIRYAIAMILFGLAMYFKSSILVFVALFVLFEALSGWCVVYQMLGKNSCPTKTSPMPLLSYFLTGIKILVVAIVLNFIANWIGFSTWHDFLNNPKEILSVDNYLYLFLLYPFLLGTSALIKIR
jgi:hypothetical protein